jgi:hypothetical protein
MMSLAQGQGVNEAGKSRYAARQGSYQPVFRQQGSGNVNLGLRSQGIAAVDLPDQNITFNSPAGRFYDGVEAQYITNSQRAQLDGKNINLQPALRNIQNPDGSPVDDASKAPFIGAVAGERTPNMPGTDTNYRFRKGFGPGVSLEQGYTDLESGMAKGKRKYSQARVDTNIALGQEIERRTTGMNEDSANRRVMQQAESALFDEYAYKGPSGDRNRDVMIESIRTGQSLPGRRTDSPETIERLFPSEGQRFGPDQLSGSVVNNVNSNDPMIDSQFRRIGLPGRARPVSELYSRNIQTIEQSPVKASIAPDPWAEVPVAREQVESMVNSKPQRFGNFNEGPVDSVLGESKRRKRSSSFGYMSEPDGPKPGYLMEPEYKTRGRGEKIVNDITNEIGKRAKRQLFSGDAAPTRNRRIGYSVGGLAALGSILGIGRSDEQDRREQY